MPMVLIFGKDACPYTIAAREHFEARGEQVDYRNVRKSAPDLERMLEYSGGKRRVPVIVQNGRVTIGFGGT